MPTRLTEALKSLTELQHLTVASPTAIDNLPHPTSVTCLKLFNLPRQYIDDWKWLAHIQRLQEIDVTFVDKDAKMQDPVHQGCAERLHIHNGTAESSNMSADGTGNILSNLPDEMTQKVFY